MNNTILPQFGISLTFDVESHEIGEPRQFAESMKPILDVLIEKEIKATFFVCGNLIRYWKDEIKLLDSHGFEIGLHGAAWGSWRLV